MQEEEARGEKKGEQNQKNLKPKMSRVHGDAARKVSVGNDIKTFGPQMGNITVKAYHEEREHHRSTAGRSDFFPAQAYDRILRIDPGNLCFMFKDSGTRVVRGATTTMYPGQVGYPVFSVFNGITLDKFDLYSKLNLIGVSKSHTRLNDRGTGSWTQNAIFRGGSATILNNGTKTIEVNSDIKVVLYDAYHDPEMFKALFEAPDRLDKGQVRVLGVVEPYDKHDNIVTLLRHYHPHPDVGSASRPSGHSRVMFGSVLDTVQFTAEACAERMISASSGTLLMGYILGKFIEERVNAGNIDNSASRMRTDLRSYLNGKTASSYSMVIDAFFNQGSAENTGISELIARALFPGVATDQIVKNGERVRKNGMLVMRKAQAHATDLYESVANFYKWEREWVIGQAQNRADPIGALDLIIRR